MKRNPKALFIFLSLSFLVLLSGCKMALLDPKGVIAADQSRLLLTAVGLMLTIVIPVIILTLFFAWRFRSSNTKAQYRPDWSHSTLIEIVCWTVPCIIISILATLTWYTSHSLDPYKPIDSKIKPLVIQVVALDWKWLFIYPEQKIATVNFLEIPAQVPVQFDITADAPMNSLQIPRLAGQIYAMPGMKTKLNILANEEGTYYGQSSSFSGEYFSDMNFNVVVASQDKFNQWIKQLKRAPLKLTTSVYNQLAHPGKAGVTMYSDPEQGLFDSIVMKPMTPENHKMDAMAHAGM